MDFENNKELHDTLEQLQRLGDEQTNATLGSWYFGKASQTLRILRRDCKHVEENEEYDRVSYHLEEKRSQWSTSLSPRVALLFLVTEDQHKEYYSSQRHWKTLLDCNGFLQFEQFTIQQMTPNQMEDAFSRKDEIVNQSREELLFASSVDFLKRNCFISLHDWFINGDDNLIDRFQHLYSGCSSFYHQPSMLLALYRLHISQDNDQTTSKSNSLLAFTVLVSYFERSLGDILVSFTGNDTVPNSTTLDTFDTDSKSIEVPNKLSELLLHPILEILLGKDIIFLLRVCIGPLNGLNLRNTVWHGFVAPDEFYAPYTSFVFLLMLSVFNKLSTSTFLPKVIHRPPYADLEQISKQLNYESRLDLDWSEKSVVNLVSTLKSSFFIIPRTESLWYKALLLFCKGNEVDGSLDYVECMSILFPLLEHAIRRIFVNTNQCSQKMMTAESDVLFTTLDIILAEKVTDKQTQTSTPNLLFEEIGESIANILYDLFYWEQGPRIRDLVSHGLIDPYKIPRAVCEYVVIISVGICLHYSVHNDGSQEYLSSLSPLERHCLDSVLTYKPLFHPKTELNKGIKDVAQMYHDFQQFVAEQENTAIPKDVKVDIDNSEILDRTDFIMSQIESIKSGRLFFRRQFDIKEFDHFSLRYWIPCTSKEAAKITILNNVVKHCSEFLVSITEIYQDLLTAVNKREAWKRDRKSFAVLLKCLPVYRSIVQLLMMIVEEQSNSPIHESGFALRCFTLSGSIASTATSKGWLKILALFQCFISSKLIPSMNLLSKKEVSTFWGDIDDYVENLKHQK